MKVKLLKDLKGNGQVIAKAGTVYSSPIPDFIMKRVNQGFAEIIEADPVVKKVTAPLAPGGKQGMNVPVKPITNSPVSKTIIPEKSESSGSDKVFPEKNNKGGQSKP